MQTLQDDEIEIVKALLMFYSRKFNDGRW